MILLIYESSIIFELLGSEGKLALALFTNINLFYYYDFSIDFFPVLC